MQQCPKCFAEINQYRNPVPTVDIIIELDSEIVLIERKNPPYGYALPGGFVDYGESIEAAAIREAREETNLDVELEYLLGVYSDPERDPRFHTISTVLVARASGQPEAGDDAANVLLVNPEMFDGDLAFDHFRIIEDYLARR